MDSSPAKEPRAADPSITPPDVQASSPPQRAAGAIAQAPVNILLVDDNPSKLIALEMALAPLGERLIIAASGADALRELLARDFAVIILDVSMPLMDGFETARMIRGRPRSANTPIIFASAINLAEADALRGYALGAVDYINAPIVPEVLRAKVAVFVQLHRKTEEARRHARELEERTRQLEQSQTQLRLAERMASLGTLAAGLGHDMGNLLLPIQTRLDDLDLAELPPEIRENLQGLSTTIGYLRRLASGLRLLALPPTPTEVSATHPHHEPGDGTLPGDTRSTHDPITPLQTTELMPWWTEVEPMLRNVLPPTTTTAGSIELTCHIQHDTPPVPLPKHLLTQLVFNLVQNAGDILRGRTDAAVRIAITPAPEGGAILLRVSDNGPGMPSDVRQRCIEPFFTTKSRTFSTGLGLSIVNGIIQRCGGAMEIDSAPGRGTTFTCRIPTTTAPAALPLRHTTEPPLSPNLTATSAPPTPPNPRNAVLTVHDPRTRAILSSFLRIHGFEIHTAPQALKTASLWVADGDNALVREAPEFLSASGDHQILILGEAPSLLPCPTGPGVHILPAKAAIPELRAAITAITRPRSNRPETHAVPAVPEDQPTRSVPIRG
jgi:signal transduction histidine kinase